MDGYSGPMSESLGMPQDMAQNMRRRGLLPALMQTQPQSAPMSESLGLPAGKDRIQDDPITRSNPQAYGEPQAQAPVGQSPTQRDTLSDQMWQEYQRLGQPQAPPPQPSLKDRILRGLMVAAPIAAGAIGGGAYGAEGAAQGEVGALQRQQGMRLAQQQMAQQHEQQRNSLRERMLQEMMMNQRMQQQGQQFEERETQRDRLAQQQQQGQEQRLGERMAATDKETEQKQEFQRQQAEAAEQGRNERQEKQLKAQSENEDKKLAVMMQRMGQTEQGSWSMQEDPQTGKPVLFNAKTGQTRAAPPGVGPKGSFQKNLGGPIAAQNFAQDYLARGVFTGPGDEALQEKFFDLAKPEVGFRMTQPQINQLQASRNWMNSIQGRFYHATRGTWFSDTQRQQIVATMNELAEAKKAAHAAQGGQAQPASGLQITRDANGRIIGVQ